MLDAEEVESGHLKIEGSGQWEEPFQDEVVWDKGSVKAREVPPQPGASSEGF